MKGIWTTIKENMSRKIARENTFKLIFEYTFSKEKDMDLFEEYVAGLDADDVSYVKEVYEGVILHYDELVGLISSNIKNFEFDRLYKVDVALLLLAIYEIKFMQSIPFKVSVDEALNLAQKYSTEKSMKYINGVLTNFAR